ncbi:hypothetical protein ACA910_009771 [Epithemia clementina (nom. ined.)]
MDGDCCICCDSYWNQNDHNNSNSNQEDDSGELGVCVPCGHGFHKACFDQWAEHQPRRSGSGRRHRPKCPSCNTPAQTFVKLYLNLTRTTNTAGGNHRQTHDNDDNDEDEISLDSGDVQQEEDEIKSMLKQLQADTNNDSPQQAGNEQDPVSSAPLNQQQHDDTTSRQNEEPPNNRTQQNGSSNDTRTQHSNGNGQAMIEILDDDDDDRSADDGVALEDNEVIVLDGPAMAPPAHRRTNNLRGTERNHAKNSKPPNPKKYKRLALKLRQTLQKQRDLHADLLQQKEQALHDRQRQFQDQCERETREAMQGQVLELQASLRELQHELQAVRLERQTALREKEELSQKVTHLEVQVASTQQALQTAQAKWRQSQQSLMQQYQQAQQEAIRVAAKNADLKKQLSKLSFLFQQQQQQRQEKEPKEEASFNNTSSSSSSRKRPATTDTANHLATGINRHNQSDSVSTLVVPKFCSNNNPNHKKPKTKQLVKDLGSIVTHTQQDPAPPLTIRRYHPSLNLSRAPVAATLVASSGGSAISTLSASKSLSVRPRLKSSSRSSSSVKPLLVGRIPTAAQLLSKGSHK